MSVSAMKQALKAFNKIYDGCGEVKKDNISKHSNDLATLVRKDCNFAIANLREAIAEAEKQEPDVDIYDIWVEQKNLLDFAEAIEAKLKEKNSG